MSILYKFEFDRANYEIQKANAIKVTEQFIKDTNIEYVCIVQSNNAFYIEDDIPLVREWERLIKEYIKGE